MRLVLAPHIDDDVLGCASVLDAEAKVLYCATDESSVEPGLGRVPAEVREREADKASDLGGYDFIELVGFRVNALTSPEVIGPFERIINHYKPTEVYIPWPSYNQDHQAVFRAAMVALRPHDVNWFVPRVFAYEQIHVAQWDVYPERRFQPTYYRSLDIDKKLAMYAAMASQVRSFRSPDMIRAHAALRGAACGMPYAEAFEVLRWVEQ